jgi:outer membrane protein OmpA-like peptidoglycan-associated protein
MKIKTTFALGGLLMTTACTSLPVFGASARSECQSSSHIIYYNLEEDDIRASANPIIQLIAHEVEMCRKAGGGLQRVSIVGFPNRADNSDSGDATAAARGQAVLGALIASGIPNEKIAMSSYRLEKEDINQPMRRRAEIEVEMR